jgi:alkylation response protein AidB-like acyl-CoA dehydrogenase
MAVTDAAPANKGISAFILDEGLPGFRAGRPTASSACMPRTPPS